MTYPFINAIDKTDHNQSSPHAEIISNQMNIGFV